MKKLLYSILFLSSLYIQGQTIEETFNDGTLEYTVTSVSPNEVSVATLSTGISGALAISETVTDNSIVYSVTGITEAGFKNATSLTSVDLSSTNITSIGIDGFNACNTLESITLPNTLEYIGNRAFTVTSALTSIDLPNSVTDIRPSAFLNSGLTSIIIPSGVTQLTNTVFSNSTSLETITIPASVTSTQNNCFKGCTALTNVRVSWGDADSILALNTTIFSGITLGDVTLSIPLNTSTFYEAKNVWTDFNIVEDATIVVLSSNTVEATEKVLKIYPNPIADYMTIQLDGDIEFVNAIIYNLSGKEVKTTTASVVNLQDLAQGVYFVKVNTNKNRITQKIIVE